LLSGGCLEGDLREHARSVLASGRSRTVTYDMRSADDELWGLGAGCEGAMEILLQRMGVVEGWQPFAGIRSLIAAGQRAIATLSIPKTQHGTRDQPAPHCWVWQLARHPRDSMPATDPQLANSSPAPGPDAQQRAFAQAQRLAASEFSTPIADDSASETLISLPYAPPPALLLLGAGPDAPPVAQLAHFLGWRIAVHDHRASLIDVGRFPAGTVLSSGAAQALRGHLDPSTFDATVIMSHQLNADRDYLRALAAAPCRYIGLLGPAPRREKLLGELSPAEARALRPALHAPVGLDLGGRSPEAIALSIVAGIQAHLHGRPAATFRTPEIIHAPESR
jgi:xanthine/CO dehydrogenase XdhC/CoxF family maturation factor